MSSSFLVTRLHDAYQTCRRELHALIVHTIACFSYIDNERRAPCGTRGTGANRDAGLIIYKRGCRAVLLLAWKKLLADRALAASTSNIGIEGVVAANAAVAPRPGFGALAALVAVMES